MQSESSSRYVNTEHKRNQISINGGNPGYNLSKNKASDSKNKKKRPQTAGRRTGKPASGNIVPQP